jgi:hypothetical protein
MSDLPPGPLPARRAYRSESRPLWAGGCHLNHQAVTSYQLIVNGKAAPNSTHCLRIAILIMNYLKKAHTQEV